MAPNGARTPSVHPHPGVIPSHTDSELGHATYFCKWDSQCNISRDWENDCVLSLFLFLAAFGTQPACDKAEAGLWRCMARLTASTDS